MLNKKGFTLIEILVALAVFALGLVVLMRLQTVSIKGSGFNKEATNATILAQKYVEQIKGTAYTSIATNTTGVQDQITGITYTTTWSVSEFGTAPSRYKTLTVTVTWTGTSTTTYTKSTTLDTIISEI